MEPSAALAARALALVDLTDLSDTCTVDAIDQLCERAVGPYGHTAAVCVWPRFVSHAAFRLRGSGVVIATVVNFPAGGDGIDATIAETVRALHDGADEIDLVLPYRAFLAGDVGAAEAMVAAVRARGPPPQPAEGDPRDRQLPRPRPRRRPPLASRSPRGRLREDVDRQDEGVGHHRRRRGDAQRDPASPAGPSDSSPRAGSARLDDAAAYLGLADRIMGPDWASPPRSASARAACSTPSRRSSRATPLPGSPDRRGRTEGDGHAAAGDHPQEA
jgi:deoxyribose-phosphate aldolase